MKIINVIYFLVISFSVLSQRLPENNKKIINYVDDNIGKKVGDGVCQTLVDRSLKSVDKHWDKKYIKTFYGVKIDHSEIIPGDILIFKGVRDTRMIALSHIAIVYKIEDGNIYIAEQNTGKTLKESRVSIDRLRTLDPQKGKIIAYRYK